MRLQFQCARIDSNQGARSSDDPLIVYYPAPSRARGFVIERHPPALACYRRRSHLPSYYTATNNATTSITAVAAMKASALNSFIRHMPRSPVRWSAICNEERPGHRDPGPFLTSSAPPLNLRKRIEIVPERECSAARGYIAVGWELTATTLVCVVGHTPASRGPARPCLSSPTS
jgi:hypothetical protein